MSAERRFIDSHPYEIKKLWEIAKNKPILAVPVQLLDQSHKKRHWKGKHGRPISAYEVFQNPAFAPDHARQTEEADLSYPIILAASNLDILDGLHRLNKCLKLGKTDIKAQLVSVKDLKQNASILHPTSPNLRK